MRESERESARRRWQAYALRAASTEGRGGYGVCPSRLAGPPVSSGSCVRDDAELGNGRRGGGWSGTERQSLATYSRRATKEVAKEDKRENEDGGGGCAAERRPSPMTGDGLMGEGHEGPAQGLVEVDCQARRGSVPQSCVPDCLAWPTAVKRGSPCIMCADDRKQ